MNKIRANTDPESLGRIQAKLEAIKRKYATKESEKRMWKCVLLLKNEIKKVIHEYNHGILDREYIGFKLEAFDEDYLAKLDHAPLIDTGFYWNNWEANVVRSMGKVVGIVGTNTEYAEFLENGTWSMEGFHVVSIALDRCRDKIRKILKGEMDDAGESIVMQSQSIEVDK